MKESRVVLTSELFCSWRAMMQPHAKWRKTIECKYENYSIFVRNLKSKNIMLNYEIYTKVNMPNSNYKQLILHIKNVVFH
jgi:hypothetical protein